MNSALDNDIIQKERKPEEKIIPGIFEKIEKIDLTDKSILLENIITFDELVRLYGETQIIWSESFLSVREGHMSFKDYAQNRLYNLIDRLKGVTVLSSRTEETEIIFSEIHCPKVEGCEAYHIQETTSTKKHYTELKVFGLGGGSGKSVEFGTGMKMPSIEECRYLTKPIRVQIEECTDGNQNFDRITILEIKDGCTSRVIPSPEDECHQAFNFLQQDKKWVISPYDAPYPDHPFETTYTVRKGQEWNHSLGVNIGPMIFYFKIATRALQSTIHKYKLVGPRRYHAYHLPRSLNVYWTW